MEKCHAIRDTLYQPPPHIDGLEEPDLDSAHPSDLPYKEVTRDEVRLGIFDPNPKKAPGEEGEREREILYI